MELKVVRDDGVRLTQLAYAAPLRDEQGRVRGAVGAYLDITALRELERAREGVLLAAAHDLRTPLTVISGRVQIAQRELVRLGTPELAPVVALLERALERAEGMQALVRELGEVACHQLGGMLDLRPRPTDLVELMRAAVEALRVVCGRTIHLEMGTGSGWRARGPSWSGTGGASRRRAWRARVRLSRCGCRCDLQGYQAQPRSSREQGCGAYRNLSHTGHEHVHLLPPTQQ
jgi:signal transduction histidine kinase